MALKDFEYVNSRDRKRQLTSKNKKKSSRTRNKRGRRHNFFSDLILSTPYLSNIGVSLETLCKIILKRYHNPLAMGMGDSYFFSVMRQVFFLMSGVTDDKRDYRNFGVIERKQQANYFFRVSFANKYSYELTNPKW